MSYSSKLHIIKEDNNGILANLPTDILLHIFSLCGQDWWPAIAQVCHRFNIILGPNSFLWEQIAKQLLFVNQSSPNFQSKWVMHIIIFNLLAIINLNMEFFRIHTFLSAQLRFRVNSHWKRGVCLVKPIASIREKWTQILFWKLKKTLHLIVFPFIPGMYFLG